MNSRLWKNVKQRLRLNCCFSGHSPGINLSAALAAGRSQNAGEELKTLMSLFEETETETETDTNTDGWDGESETERGKDRVCCVCMVRNKGAAFIPCGHTFCRVCSKELWLKRECCPLCNRWILHILDIF